MSFGCGEFWWVLVSSGSVVVGSCEVWGVLVGSGEFCWVLVSFGEFLVSLAVSGGFWWVLMGSGEFC